MAGGNNLYVRGQVEMILKDKGLLDMKTRLESLEKSAAKTARGVEGLGASAAKAGAMLAGFLSAGALISFAKTAVLEFAKVDRAFSTIGIQLEALGKTSAAELPKIKAALLAIERAGGPVLEETVPAFNKFLLATNDVGKALFLAKLAADLSETGMTDVAGAADILSQLLNGKTKGALATFGAIMRDNTGKTRTAAEIIEFLVGKFDGLVTRTNDSQDEVDKLTNAWASFKREVGAGLAPVLTWLLGAFDRLTSGLALAGSHVVVTVQQLAEGIGTIWRAGFDGLFSEEGQRKLSAQLTAMGQRYAAIRAGMNAEANRQVVDDAAPTGAAAGEAEGKAHAEMLGAILHQARAAEIREAEEAAREGAEKIRKVIDDELFRMRATIKDIQDAQAKRVAERTEKDLSGKEGVDFIAKQIEFAEQLRAQQKAFVDDLLAQLQETGPAMFNLQRMQLETWYQEQKRMAQGNAAALLVIDQRYVSRKRAIDSAQIKWEKMSAKEKRDAALGGAEAVLGGLSALFPKVKAFAIAEAIISTYRAAALALESPPGPPVSFAYVAATILQGLAQVQRIRKTNAGFDDPAHDRLARVGGYRWAGDMVREFMRGSTEGWGAAMQNPMAAAAATVSNTNVSNATNYGGSTINIKVGWMDDIMLTKLKRELETITQRDRSRSRR